MGSDKKIFIIDGHSHIFAAFYAPMRGDLTSPDGEPTKAVYIFTQAILGVLEKYWPDMLVVAMDAAGPSFRHEMYDEYKAHRAEMPADLPPQIEWIEQILQALGVAVVRVEGFEADDLIGTIARQASEAGVDAYICSKDKDMLQLIDEHVCVFDISKGARVGLEELREKFGVSPAQFLDALALQGDTSDNVPGVADVGPKTALKWIQQYGDIENLYEHADEIGGKRGQTLRASRPVVDLSKRLVTIDCDVPLEVGLADFELGRADTGKLREIFEQLGFGRLLGRLDELEGRGKTEGRIERVQTTAEEERGVKEQGPESIRTAEHEYVLVDDDEKFERFLGELAGQKLFAIDTETTSIEAMRAELVGMSFCWEDGQAWYLPVKGPLGSRYLDVGMVREKLGPILADEAVRKVGQNIKYDMLVLRGAGLELGGVWFDTMVAAYCLDPQRARNSMDALALDFLNYECIPISAVIGKGRDQLTFDMVDCGIACEYAAEDADVTYRLYKRLAGRLGREEGLEKLFFEVEMPLVAVLAQMEWNGVSVDAGLLRRMAGGIAEQLEGLRERIYEKAGRTFNIDSPKQLGQVLFDELGLEASVIGKTGRSTSAEVLGGLRDEHPIAGLVLEYRQLSKLQNTYVDKLGALINPRTGRVHASFNQTVTATGRLSSSDPNLQNIPVRTELGRKIRAAFVTGGAGLSLVSADYSQIELRLLAHFSKDATLLRAFEEGADIHRFVASQVYGVSMEEVTGEMRSSCKAVNFGIIYGQGAFGLSREIGISQRQAKEFIEEYFARYGSIREWMDGVVARAKVAGYAETILGRRRRLTGLNSRNANKRSQGRRLAVNTVIQGSAADLIKVAMINIQRRIEQEEGAVRMVLQIHDELVFEVPAEDVDRCVEWISEEMTGALELDVPLKVDVVWGKNWLGQR